MGIARKCDRCGTYHDGRIYEVTIESSYYSAADEEHDLCSDCKNELDEFMKGAKPKNLLERLIGKKKE